MYYVVGDIGNGAATMYGGKWVYWNFLWTFSQFFCELKTAL